MSIWQRRIATSPEERGAERIRDLERGLAAKARNSQVVSPQRVTTANYNAAGFVAQSVFSSFQVQIPQAGAMVQMSWVAAGTASAAGTNGGLVLLEATDFPAGVALHVWQGPGPVWMNSGGGYGGGGAITNAAMSSWVNPYSPLWTAAYTPTPGLRTYQMAIQRQGGAGTVGIQNFTWSIIVV